VAAARPPERAEAEAEEKTEFDVILTGAGTRRSR